MNKSSLTQECRLRASESDHVVGSAGMFNYIFLDLQCMFPVGIC